MKTKTKKLSFFYKKVCDRFYISQNIHFIKQIDVDIKDPIYINVLFDVNSVEERSILF